MTAFVNLPWEQASGKEFHGFKIRNSTAEAMRDFVLLRAKAIDSTVYDKLIQADFAGEWWPGKDFELPDVIECAGGIQGALGLVAEDDETIRQIPQINSIGRTSVRKALGWTRMLLRGEIKGIRDDLPGYRHPPCTLSFQDKAGARELDDRNGASIATKIDDAIFNLDGGIRTLVSLNNDEGGAMMVGGGPVRFVVTFTLGENNWTLETSTPEEGVRAVQLVAGGQVAEFDAAIAVTRGEAIDAAQYFYVHAGRDPEMDWRAE
ncbi:MAG: hypothetical protein H6839_15470 [Planctomycetes bacterium]|nr:hypothetical protein [Planctomycetota bacterium]